MYKRKLSDATEIRNVHRTTPVKDHNGHRETSTTTSVPTKTSTARKQQQHRMMLIRSNATKNYFSINTPQMVILCLICMIGIWGFVGTWMALEINAAVNTKANNTDTNNTNFYKQQIIANRRALESMVPKLRNRKAYDKIKKEYENIRKRHAIDPVGKEIVPDGTSGAPNNQNHDVTVPPPPPFRLLSERAPECYELESPEDVTVTLVTQVSHDRLWMMKHHCDRYRNKQGGPLDQHKMSIAVYSNATLDKILDELREMDCGVADKIDIGIDNRNSNSNRNSDSSDDQAPVEVSVLNARTHGAWNDFPVNELRNLALSKVQTTHILYIDVDFWPSDDLYEIIMGKDKSSDESNDGADASGYNGKSSRKSIRQELVDDPKLALVIPAFQLWRQCREWEDCREDNFPHMEASRSFEGMLRETIDYKSITVFDPTNKGGHGSTDYHTWLRQPPGSLYDIECLQSHRYEPFVMVRYCKDLPPFQTAFAGYGKNKVTWMMQVIASGYIFSQVGGVYLVHYPHLDSASRQIWNGGALKTDSPTRKKESKRGQIDKLFVDFKRWLKEMIPAAQQRLVTCEDAQDDDSKLWVAEETKPSKMASKE